MSSMDSLFGSADNSSVDDLLDIQNSVAFLSRVFGKIFIRPPRTRTLGCPNQSTDGHYRLSMKFIE